MIKMHYELKKALGIIEEFKRIPIDQRPEPEDLLNFVSKRSQIPPEKLIGKSRRLEIMPYKQIYQYLLRNSFGFSLRRIAEMSGVKDHTAVLNSITRTERHWKSHNEWLRRNCEEVVILGDYI